MSRYSHHGNYMASYQRHEQDAASVAGIPSPRPSPQGEGEKPELPAPVKESRAVELQKLREELAGMQERLENWGALLVGATETLDILRYRLQSAASELESADLMARGELVRLNR